MSINTHSSPPAISRTGLMVYSTLSITIVAVLFLSNWPTFNHVIRGGLALFWFYLFACLLIVPIICAEPSFAVRFLKEPLFWWVLIFLVSGTLWLLPAQGFAEQADAAWRTRMTAFGLFYAITILSIEAKRPFVALVIVGCVLFACASTWFDVLRPFRFIPQGEEGAHSGRGAGFFTNPNVAGAFIAMGAMAVLPFVPMRFRGALLLCAVVGIVPTFSRSGYVYSGLLLVGPIMLRLLSRPQIAFILIAAPLLVVATASSYDFLLSSSDDPNLHNVVRRMEWFQGVSQEDETVEGRVYGARQAWNMFLDEPITGHGLGATRVVADVKEGPHNMYLMLMAEQGFVGLALYVALVLLVGARGRQLARTAIGTEGRDIGNMMVLYATFLFAYGFFSHNVLEEPQGMFTLAFIVAAASGAPRAVHAWKSAPVAAFRRRATRSNVKPGLG